MAHNSVYLNFTGNAEEAFTTYKTIFGTEFLGPIMRHGEVPAMEGAPALTEAEKQMVMNVQLPITGGLVLMATDIPASMQMPLHTGNNVSLGVHPDTREEADRLFAALTDGGEVGMPMQDMFWGDYYGNLTDKYGVQWYIAVSSQR
ncbi:MAG: VOC family protein [Thermomicrobiales bacterium]